MILSKYFLKYMNQALLFYKKNDKVSHISAYSYPIDNNKKNFYFTKLTLSWGWGSWRREWSKYTNNPDYYINKFSEEDIYKFNYDNTNNFWQQVINNKKKLRSTYSIYLYCQSFINNKLSLSPRKSYE